MSVYHWAVVAFALVFVGIGLALLAVTAAQGGGVVGFVLGGLFVALGVGRLTLERRRRSGAGSTEPAKERRRRLRRRRSGTGVGSTEPAKERRRRLRRRRSGRP
jgi:hypothetical protein